MTKSSWKKCCAYPKKITFKRYFNKAGISLSNVKQLGTCVPMVYNDNVGLQIL